MKFRDVAAVPMGNWDRELSFRPLLVMRRINLDPAPRCRLDPCLAFATTWKDQRVDLIALDHSEAKVTVLRNVLRDGVPHKGKLCGILDLRS